MGPQCPECRRFVGNLGARHHGEGYAAAWSAVGTCSRHGEVGISWDWLGGWVPEEVTD